MAILNITNNVSEDYTYIMDTEEIFFDKASIPTGLFIYNNSWTTISTSNNNFDTQYNLIKQTILNYNNTPQLIDYDDDFTSLLPVNNEDNITKKLIFYDSARETTEGYKIIIALQDVIESVTLTDVNLNAGFSDEDYYEGIVDENHQVIFSDIPQGEYVVYIITTGDDAGVYTPSQTINFNNNYKAIVTIINNNLTIRTSDVSPVYIGIKTQSQTGFPDIPISQYFAMVLTDDLKACIPIKSLSFSNTKITDIESYTPDDNEYLSAQQTLNLVKKELEKVRLFQFLDSISELNNLTNPQTNRIYFVQKTSDASDGLNLTFDLYAYNPDYTSNDNKYIKLDKLEFDIRDFAEKNHASSSTTYGLGTTSNYGHVKTINGLTTSSYSDGQALSAYQGKVLNDNKAPNSHASSATTYGVGTGSNYGHVKTINNLTKASYVDGEALSAYQGKVLNDNKASSTHSHGNITNSGTLNVSHNGTYTKFVGIQDSTGTLYSVSKLNTDSVIDTSAHSNINSDANANQSVINDKINTALGGKQNTLVSGSTIKTINNESILGTGNIAITGYDLSTSVTGFSNTLTDSKAPSEKLIKEYIDGLIEDIQDYIYS